MTFGGCNKTQEPPIIELTPEELEALTNSNFSSEPFEKIKYDSLDVKIRMSNQELEALISKVPSDRYEIYPYLHNVPKTATLYKDGEITFLAATDPRLIGLINLYNNSVYYDEYAYTQGLLDIDYLNQILNDDYRLVLTFTPNNDKCVHYDTNIWSYGTFVITNESFTLINYDAPGIEEDADRYPFKAIGHLPLLDNYPWLDLFGF